MRSFFLLAMFSIITFTQVSAQETCDVNGDGQVNIADVNKVITRMCTGPDTARTASHRYVNLGLPSGTLWATCNVGANTPQDYGDYFAWGDIDGYATGAATGHTYEWANYRLIMAGCSSWAQITKYTVADGQKEGIWYDDANKFIGDGKSVLDAADDAASVNWGDGWCTPSRAQMKELLEETNSECVTFNGVYGMKFSSKENPSISIFLPAAGCCSYGTLNNAGTYGFYWTNDLYTGYTDLASMYYFYSGFSSADFGDNRCTGHSVRPVRKSTK